MWEVTWFSRGGMDGLDGWTGWMGGWQGHKGRGLDWMASNRISKRSGVGQKQMERAGLDQQQQQEAGEI
ncbi:hypothetical protein K456DRAFT_59041 [Colletotrichum gloeosporioides 23]|nr:hypothetical protein K456DRAFT_59041 [Colletotrichum gloeosporioides 23]